MPTKVAPRSLRNASRSKSSYCYPSFLQEFAEDPFFEWDIETKGLIPAWVEEVMHRASAMDHHVSPSKRAPAKPKSSQPRSSSSTTATTAVHGDKTFSSLDKTLDDDVETVLRDWNENVKRREKETFQVRPVRGGSSQRIRGSGGFGPSYIDRSFGENDPKAKFLNIERVGLHDRESVLDSGEDPIIDSSSESLEDDMKRPLYVICPRTGRKIVRMQFDVHGFDSKDIKVKAVGRKVIMFAMHKETESGRKSTNEFCRKINLPDDVDVDRLQCTFINGILTMEAPVFVKSVSLSGSRQSVSSTGSKTTVEPHAPLNQPYVKASELGQVMHINVEVGRVFRADDVVVKLRGSDKLIITANREEENDHTSLSASLKREFRLPRRIHPHSLRAGLTNDGVLNVTAIMDEAVSVVANGSTSSNSTSGSPSGTLTTNKTS